MKFAPMYRLLLLAAALLLATGIQAQGAMSPDFLLNMKRVSQSALSPDGKHVAYTVIIPGTDTSAPSRAKSELHVLAIKSGEDKIYISNPLSASRVAWSPDGQYISFLATIKTHHDNPQVYRIPLAGGAFTRISSYPDGISNYEWSADGRWLAFVSADVPDAEEKAAKVRGEDWNNYDTRAAFPRLYVMNVSSGENTLVSGELAAWRFTWSPDNATLLFQGTTSALTDASYMFSRLYTVNRDGSASKQLCETEGKLGPMAFAPNGKQIAFLGATSLNDPLTQSVFTVSAAGGKPLNISAASLVKGSADNIVWEDGNTLLLLATEGTTTTLSKLTAGGSKRTIFRDNIIKASVSLHTPSNTISVVGSTPAHPTELFIGESNKGTLKRMTNSNPELASIRLARQEAYQWQAADGLDINGILTYPLNYTAGKIYPLILQIHGGPEGVSRNGWNSNPLYPVQLLAAEGYFVLEPNYRGSGGHGVAFSKADHDDLGGKEFEDVLAGIDALVAAGLVNNDQVGTGGWSYGGFFSAWAATKHSERFKASAVCAGLTNWISFAGTTDIPHEMSLVHWNNYWYDQPQLHNDRSPMMHINNARTPTLLIHGEVDARVHPEQSIQMYGALKLKGIPTRLLTYPREGHGLSEKAHQAHYMQVLLEWFNTYVRESAEKAPEKAQLIN